MRQRAFLPLLALLAAAALLAGCQGDDDALTRPDRPADAGTSLVRGEITGDAVAFEFVSEAGDDEPGPPPGPFVIRGRDVHYDAEPGALLVAVTVTNAGERTYPEPASLSFVSLAPAGVTILNADNDETGAGAMFALPFANDDGEWTPGEESLPRAIQFGVDEGVSIGFAARIDVGMQPDGGSVGGLVWHDLDEDGEVDADEDGLGDVAVEVRGAGEQTWLAVTAPDGSYRVDGLPAGVYTVTRLPREDLRPTTTPQLQVVLVEGEDGEIADFLAADFGCLVLATPPDDGIDVGDGLHVKGEHAPAPHRLVAHHYCALPEDDDEDDDGWCPERLVGPVTAIDLEHGRLAVMGALVHLADDTDVDLDLDDLAPGDRVRVDVRRTEGDDDETRLLACRLRAFAGHWDRVRGTVDEVVTDDDDHVVQVRILGVPIDVADAHDDCDDDDDDDDDDDS